VETRQAEPGLVVLGQAAERQAALDQLEAALAAARCPGAADLVAALDLAASRLWAEVGAPLAAALEQVADQWAEHLRLLGAALRRAEVQRRCRPLLAGVQPVADLEAEPAGCHPVEP